MRALLDLVPLLLALAIPFMLGIVVGIEIVKRRPATETDKLGAAVKRGMVRVREQRMFVGVGAEITCTFTIETQDGRNFHIAVREAA